MALKSDLVSFFKLDAHFDPVTSSTKEILETSDPEKGLRNVRIVKEWTRIQEIGDGTFGTVWLEHERHSKGKSRAVKQIKKKDLPIDYDRELLALSRLSKVCLTA